MPDQSDIQSAWLRKTALGIWVLTAALACSSTAKAQGWQSYGQNSQHACLAQNSAQLPQVIAWQTPVDLNPQYSGHDLYIHYGSPLITHQNVVIVPVKTAATGSFRVDARHGVDGSLIWSLNSDYSFPHHNWVPSFGPSVTPADTLVAIPGAGGTVIFRDSLSFVSGKVGRLAFYGMDNYNQNPAAFNDAIQICTPITWGIDNKLYFGYVSSGAPLPGFPNGIPSGLAQLTLSGTGIFKSAATLSGDGSMAKVSYNCAPALSSDGTSLYVAVNNVAPANSGNFGAGYLCKVRVTDLSRVSSVYLNDPRPGIGAANITDDSTAAPTIGPDGDVYYGVLEGNFPSNHDRGWMLHFSGDLATTKIPGAFGWDDTASVVPSSAVPSYNGRSTYLILTKYNNYAGVGGDGHNRVAVLDPNTSQVDSITGATVMHEVITVLGVTPDTEFGGTAVREWCINSAAIDPIGRCAIINSEDGHVYRWDFRSNTLSPQFPMAAATGEAYTPTVIGPDGSIYAINNTVLYCCKAKPKSVGVNPGFLLE